MAAERGGPMTTAARLGIRQNTGIFDAPMAAGKLQDQMAYPPRGMRAERAAAYIGIAPSTFHQMVDDGTMPKGIKVRGMRIWDRFDVEAAFENLKHHEQKAERNTCAMAMGISDDEVHQ